MDNKLHNLIKNYSTSSNTNSVAYAYTFGHSNSINIPFDKLGAFLNLYCEFANENDSNLCLGEVITESTCPLIINMNFSFENHDDRDIFYETNFVLKIINLIQKILLENLDISPSLSELICCVLENENSVNSDITYKKLSFHFPYCQTEVLLQKTILKPQIITALKKYKVMNLMFENPINEWEDIIENIKGIVPMYRSKPDLHTEPLLLKHIFPKINDDEIELGVENLELEKIFKPLNHKFVYKNLISNNFLAKDIELEYWIPLFLSIHFWPVITQQKREIQETETIIENDKDPRYMASIFLEMLSPERFIREDYWIVVGKCLFNIYDGDVEGLNLWTKYSIKTKQKNRLFDNCEKKYRSFRETHFNEKTLGWFAREDDVDRYNQWHEDWCQVALKEALSLVHNDVAEAVYRVFWLDYEYTGEGKNGWNFYSKSIYKKTIDAMQLRIDINNILIPMYKKFRLNAVQESIKANDKNTEAYILELTALIKKLGTRTYVSSLINMSEIKFYNQDFSRLKDMDPNLTGWKNGVIECCGDYAYFRKGKPQDYITKSTGIKFDPTLNDQHPLVLELMDWLGKVFCDKELLEFFLKDSASHLLGKNAEKRFRIWIGGTNGSKSLITKLYQFTLGEYCVDLPLSLITKTINVGSSGPSPETAQLKGAHTGFYCEPDDDDDLVGGKIKKRRGGDRFFGRGCNENGGSIEATAKEILVTNVWPDIPNADEAVIDSMAPLLFLSKFLDPDKYDVPISIEEQYKNRRFKQDPFFEQKIPDLAPAFAWLLLKYYPKYKTLGLKQPPIIKEYIQQHWDEVDPYRNFINEKIVHAYVEGTDQIDLEAYLTVQDIYEDFSKWFKSNNLGKEIPKRTKFHKEMMHEKRLGPQNSKKRWLGVKILKKSFVPKLAEI